jgi:hypothetical protein
VEGEERVEEEREEEGVRMEVEGGEKGERVEGEREELYHKTIRCVSMKGPIMRVG